MVSIVQCDVRFATRILTLSESTVLVYLEFVRLPVHSYSIHLPSMGHPENIPQ